MFFLPATYRHTAFRQGALDFLPVAPGIAAWGLMTGVAMVKSSMSTVEALAMALFVFAGSSQLAAIPLIGASAPMWVVLATGLCVNLRFVVFSVHLRPYVSHLPLWKRLMTGYFTADLSYFLFMRRHPSPGLTQPQREEQQAYLAGICFVPWLVWVTASVLGIVLANLIPTAWGLGFAGILSLVGILCSLASTRLRLMSAVVAGAAAVAAFALPLKLNILVAIAVAVVMCMAIEKPVPGGAP